MGGNYAFVKFSLYYANGYLIDTYMIIPYLTNPKPLYNHYLPIFS